MNHEFMRLLAQRLERVPWVDARFEECTFGGAFEGVDGFFMGLDLMRLEGTSQVFGFRDRRLGSIEAWSVQLIHEQRGYHDQHQAWIDVEPLGMALHEAARLALLALGLGEEEQIEGEFSSLVMDGYVSAALLSPPFLHGRMRGIGPRDAAGVLRRCADGMTPQDAWMLAAQELRASRLKELAGVLRTAPHAVMAAWDEPAPSWSSQDLARLSDFSMLSRYRPSLMPDGAWCGDLAMWAWKLYGADAEYYFGEEPDVGLTASILLGLTSFEGAALFEGEVAPAAAQDFSALAFCAGLTPELAADALEAVAEGVFPSFMWEHLQDEVGPPGWLNDIFRYRTGNGHGPSPNGDHTIAEETTGDDDDD